MKNKLVSPTKRKNSQFYWFRYVIPTRYRALVGKTEVKESLETIDLGEARRLCAKKQGEWLAKFKTFDAALARQTHARAIEAVENCLSSEALELGGLDHAVAYELEGMALAEACAFNEIDFPVDSPDHFDRISAASAGYGMDGRLIELRRTVLCSNPDGRLLAGAEAVDRIRSEELWNLASSFLDEAFELAGLPVPTDSLIVQSATEHFLIRLAEHVQPAVAELRAALPQPQAAGPTPSQPSASTGRSAAVREFADEHGDALRSAIHGDAVNAKTITEVFNAWATVQPLEKKKLIDEWRKAVTRFVSLFGDVDVDQVTTEMVEDFRDAVKALPASPPRPIACLPVLSQIEFARDTKHRTLAGPTVAKQVTGMRVLLEYAKKSLRLIRHNPAREVSVDDAKSPVNARLRFLPDELKLLFSSPLMTDPSSRSIDEFWFVFLAPLSGIRPEELGQLRPRNVREEDGIWHIAIELDPQHIRREKTDADEVNKTTKTVTSLRDVPVHWLLIEAGFIDFAKHQQAKGAEWLFESLEADRYGNRTNYASRRLNRWIRGLGIDEEEKVFYSFRHSMKRACRNSKMKEEIADLLAGHAAPSVGRKYGAGAALDVLHEAVNMIDYTSVDWDPVVACAQARIANFKRH